MEFVPTFSNTIPESAIIEAMGAFDNLAKHIIMENRGELTKTQTDIMMGLVLFGKMNMTQISRHIASSKEQTTRAVAPLVQKELVKKERNGENFRLIEVSLTEKGLNLLQSNQMTMNENLLKQLEGLTASDRRKLIKASQNACEVLRNLHAKSCEQNRSKNDQSEELHV